MNGRVVLLCHIILITLSLIRSFVPSHRSSVLSHHPSVLPERGCLQVVSVGLKHASVVATKVLAVGSVADGQLVVVTELEEEVNRRVAAAHHRLLVPHHPVFAGGVWKTGGGGERMG